MDDKYKIFRKESCYLCKGQRQIEIQCRTKKNKYYKLCPACEGKGYLNILKSDYEY